MIKAGTLCLVIGDPRECDPGAEVVLGSVVTVIGLHQLHSLVGYHCDEIYRIECCVGELKACRHALRPISDPDADVSEWAGDKHPQPVTA